MQITILTGTARQDNKSQYVAQAIANALSDVDAAVTVTSVADHITQAVTVPPWGTGGADEQPTAWQALVWQTDRFIFVLPEYNHGYPGEWKLLMDSLYADYAGKMAFVAAVGGGQFAGARVMEHVLPVLVNFKFVMGTARLHVGSASQVLDAAGEVTDAATRERIAAFAEAVASR